ncbi:hypothetical protein EUGRSUZ_L01132 [Eucalyptus grandis]|uniref:PGG domain-containing protein n=1 Tax=Eucalyptus grandis TaxID=71139 RepID=A0A058ZTU6_EUCGR|nr:hypothetical protein EUGRSUZ_L01132 [Eucalyptus grandis]
MTLQEAIAADNVNELYNLIELNKKLLDDGSKGPFPNTPLHDAAGKGKTKVAMEIGILKPSFARKLNLGGYSPMHSALQNKHYGTVRALMTLNRKLIRVRGRGGITPLHFVAMEKGDNEQENVELLELLAEFLSACKSSIEDLTSQSETAVHVAIKRDNTKAFKVLFGWLKRVRLTQILKWKDQNGNTVLHIAASKEHPEFFSRELTSFENYSNSFGIHDETARNTILVVSGLIATAAYQAVLSPPGGFRQDASSDPLANSTILTANSSSISIDEPGSLVLSGGNLYSFLYLNSAVFLLSVTSLSFAAISLGRRSFTAYLSLFVLSIAYGFFFSIELPLSSLSSALTGTLLVLLPLSLLLLILLLPILFWLRHIRVVNRVDATRRWVDNT